MASTQNIPLVALPDVDIDGIMTAQLESENRSLEQQMSKDDWVATDFTARNDEILQQILECGTLDPPAWTESSQIAALPSTETGESQSKEPKRTSRTVRGAFIEEEKFLLPYSAILCLEGTTNYLQLVAKHPSMTSDITVSLASYLQSFDSHCRRLILGAGAIKSAGLKNLTMKHLALASQALNFIATIIPHIRQFVQRHVPTEIQSMHITKKLDKVRRGLRSHRNSIYKKMVDVMASCAARLSKTARETEWSKESSRDVRTYMTELIKITKIAHNVFAKYLPSRMMEPLMMAVFKSYRKRLGKAFKKAELETESCRECMISDVEHFVDQLRKMEGFGDTGTHLIEIIESKEIKRPIMLRPRLWA